MLKPNVLDSVFMFEESNVVLLFESLKFPILPSRSQSPFLNCAWVETEEQMKTKSVRNRKGFFELFI